MISISKQEICERGHPARFGTPVTYETLEEVMKYTTKKTQANTSWTNNVWDEWAPVKMITPHVEEIDSIVCTKVLQI